MCGRAGGDHLDLSTPKPWRGYQFLVRRHSMRIMTTGWVSPQELAEELGLPVGTIYKWRYAGHGPRGHRIGKHVRFRRDDVDIWLAGCADQQRNGSAADVAPNAGRAGAP